MSNLFDSANYSTREPEEIIAGDRVAWKRSDLNSDYSNALYTLSYQLRLEGEGTTGYTITASASGTDYIIEVTSATTATYTPGRYQWQAYITRNSDSARVTLETGSLEVVANRSQSTSDPRSHAKVVLDAIEAVLESRATKDQMSYTIAGRSLSRMPVTDLLTFRDRYKAEYQRELDAERIRKGLGSKRRLLVRI